MDSGYCQCRCILPHEIGSPKYENSVFIYLLSCCSKIGFLSSAGTFQYKVTGSIVRLDPTEFHCAQNQLKRSLKYLFVCSAEECSCTAQYDLNSGIKNP